MTETFSLIRAALEMSGTVTVTDSGEVYIRHDIDAPKFLDTNTDFPCRYLHRWLRLTPIKHTVKSLASQQTIASRLVVSRILRYGTGTYAVARVQDLESRDKDKVLHLVLFKLVEE